ncbi:MAG: hypothetical protein HQ503_17530 [Rhodospirillales bacterium]|nr:hypothetical protein [Rhodospirillales bacterium]
MIGELVKYLAPQGVTRADMIEGAKGVVPHWQANPDLIRKHFMWSDDKRFACGFYLWKSRQAAEQGHNAEWRKEVEARTGQPPEISYFDVFLILDNEAGRLDELD